MQWLYRLRRYRYDQQTQLASRLVELGPSLPNRVMLVVISDMHDPSSVGVIKRLSQRHDCCVLQLRDPAERGLPGTGFYRAREAESGRRFVAHGGTRFSDHKSIKNSLRRAGIDHLLLDTDRPISIPLRQFFIDRGLLGKGAR